MPLIISLILTVLVAPTDAAILCRNGGHNPTAKAACLDEAAKYGEVRRMDEAYGAVSMGFNQINKFCLYFADGMECECYYNWAPLARERTGKYYNSADLSCSAPGEKPLYSCRQRLRDQCSGK